MIFNLEKAAPGGNDTESADVILRAKSATKSLRWLANMFEGEALEDETDKICRCIHLYCTAGADSIDALQAQLAASQQETRAAVADIPHKCWSCANGFHTDRGFDCDQAHYRGYNPDCLSWQWRGPQGAGRGDSDE